ncbi:MAG TPA: hypothetical protein VKU01_27300 [Bryobacteraceae bacterium]|nr:hypothetical protein [Bryobacteraceae bacterium]
MIMVSDDAIEKPTDFDTTIRAFNNAGAPVSSVKDLLKRGVYLTSAVNAVETDALVARAFSKRSWPYSKNAKVLMLMGDAAIKALNNNPSRLDL